MNVAALHVWYLLVSRRVRFPSLVALGSYLSCKAFYLLWCHIKLEQLAAKLDAALAEERICAGCRDRAFACGGCLVRLLVDGLVDGEEHEHEHEYEDKEA